MSAQLISVLSNTIVGVAVIAAAATLCALGKIDSSTTIALIGAGAALVSGDAKAMIALYAQPPGRAPSPPAGV